MKSRKVVITAAVTGSMGDKAKHSGLPVTPEEIAEHAIQAHAAGAAVAHIHVRNPETAEPSMDLNLYKEVVDRIRNASNMVINLTTGAGARIVPDDENPVGLTAGTTWSSPEKRTEHIVALKPEICSLDMGSMNFGPRLFANIVPHVEKMAKIILQAGVKPELEVFEMGHIEIAKNLIQKNIIVEPFIFQLCMGIPWGMPSGVKNLMMMIDSLPKGAIWGGFSIGSASFPMMAQAALLGGNVRVGFEDNFYIKAGVPAKNNADLVRKAVSILNALDMRPATADQTRDMLRLNK